MGDSEGMGKRKEKHVSVLTVDKNEIRKQTI